tara:strand:+ start:5741 stop:5938 length:198 start_codon:yes stop_codon:yes gene_type:complete
LTLEKKSRYRLSKIYPTPEYNEITAIIARKEIRKVSFFSLFKYNNSEISRLDVIEEFPPKPNGLK